jgi:hypothetical protein
MKSNILFCSLALDRDTMRDCKDDLYVKNGANEFQSYQREESLSSFTSEM